jgi:hypothetical protein
MSISRRGFLRTGTLVALSAATHSKFANVVFGQKSLSGRRNFLGGFRVPEESLNDPLTYFTKSTFSAYVNSKFRLRSVTSRSVVVTLVEVNDTAPSPLKQSQGKECFVLMFRASKYLPQETYTIEHGALGTFKMLLVPTGKDSDGKYLAAVVNRLYG